VTSSAALRAGYAQACVTPPLGLPMEGLGQQGGIAKIHDDLFVRALFLAHGRRRALLLGCDLLFFERGDVDRIKGAIGRRLDFPPGQILLNCSHNHAGPRLTRWSYTGQADPAYLDEVVEAFVDAAVAAAAGPRPVSVWAGTTTTAVPVCRRRIDAAGRAQWAPTRSGITCNALPVCVLRDDGGGVLSVLFSVSCHPSMIYFNEVSAEYPGAAVRRLNARLATGGAFFLQGAGGDAKPRPVAVGEEHWRQGTWEEMEAVGEELADAVAACVGTGLRPVRPDLRLASASMEWPLQEVPASSHFRAVAADGVEREARRLWGRDMLARIERRGGLPAAIAVEVHALQLGEGLRLIGLNGELVGELGNLILDVYDRGVTFPMGYTDGAEVYLPSDRMVAEGGYEVDSYWEYHWPAPLRPGMNGNLEGCLRRLQASGRLPNSTTG